MKGVVSLLLCLLFAGVSHAQEAGGIGELNGETVVLSPDFTWRFDDSGGERCVSVGKDTAVCALPSAWAPVAGDPGNGPIWFKHNNDIRGSVLVLSDPSGTVDITMKTVMRMINGDRGKDSDFGLSVEETKAEIAGKKPTTMVSVIGTTSTRSYSFVFLDDNKVILAITVEDPSFTYSFSHKTAHATFLNAIKMAEE